MTARRRLRALVAGVAASLVACGYSFAVGPGLATLAAGRRVTVGAFENQSAEADAGIVAARAAGRALAARGLSGRGGLVLRGWVEGVSSAPSGVAGSQDVQLWVAQVQLRLELREGAGPDAKVLARAQVAESEAYRPGNDIEATEAARELALARLFERCLDDGLDRLK